MNSYKLIIMFLIISFTISCLPSALTPNVQASPTETNVKPPPTLLTTMAVHSATLEADFPDGCVNLTETAFTTALLKGLLIVYDFDNFSNHFLDPKLNQVLDIEEKRQISSFASPPSFISAKVSPNKKYIQAYLIDKNYGIIRTVDEIIKTYDIQGQEDWNRGRWLDDERMFFQHWFDAPYGIYEIVIYNPFTGEQKEMQLELPNPYIEVDTGGRVSWVRADIDPTLKRVLYNDKDERLVLWDLDTQKEIASLPSLTDVTKGTWSPDGTEFAIPSPSSIYALNELFVIDMEGTVKMTNFNQKYPFANVSTRPSWSPDGRRIASWLRISNIANADSKTLRQWLAITDTTTLDTQIYCLSPNKPPSGGGGIVWSPDSTQVIVNTDSDALSEAVKPILVDLTKLTQSPLDTQGLWVDDWISP